MGCKGDDAGWFLHVFTLRHAWNRGSEPGAKGGLASLVAERASAKSQKRELPSFLKVGGVKAAEPEAKRSKSEAKAPEDLQGAHERFWERFSMVFNGLHDFGVVFRRSSERRSRRKLCRKALEAFRCYIPRVF